MPFDHSSMIEPIRRHHGIDERQPILRNARCLEVRIDHIRNLLASLRIARKQEECLPITAPRIPCFRKHVIERRPFELVCLGERAISANQKGLERH